MASSSTRTDEPVVSRRDIDLPSSGRSVAVVTLNRPDRLNCFNTEVCHRLAEIFSDIARDVAAASSDFDGGDDECIVAVVLTGAGRSFCAGADLSNPPDPLAQSSDLPHRLLHNPVHHMRRVGVPVIAALRGHCVTGGFELALACDILIGDATTSFRDTHVKFGLAPCWGLSQRLQRRVGPGRAALASYTARPVDAETALQWGLLDELVPKGESVMDRALEIADSVGSNDATMVRRYKRALDEGGAMDLAKGLQRERELGIAHYLEAVSDGRTFQNANEFISDDSRPRLQSKL
mmetsp:Transcript_48567/g.146482  ORF Transcript_48567/g.146482 Transcript_48567/m.146482 type:complete len:293 (-) Transcript_48567:247-1125(-)